MTNSDEIVRFVIREAAWVWPLGSMARSTGAGSHFPRSLHAGCGNLLAAFGADTWGKVMLSFGLRRSRPSTPTREKLLDVIDQSAGSSASVSSIARTAFSIPR